MPTWDRFALPRPGSRCRVVMSAHLQLPSDLDRTGIEHYRIHVESLLNRLTLEAEAWAEAGTAKLEQVPGRRQPAPLRNQNPLALVSFTGELQNVVTPALQRAGVAA
jgi:hypothetical protein